MAPSLWRNLGFGLGLRSEHYDCIRETQPKIDWLEAITENYFPLLGGSAGLPLEHLLSFRKDYPVVLHGISLSLGSSDPVNLLYLDNLKRLADVVQPAWISDHLCWSSLGGRYVYDLYPLPYNLETIQHVSDRISFVQEFLGCKILIENVSSYLNYNSSEMPEWDFINEIAKRTGCGLLLDVNNIYVSSVNHQFDPMTYLRAIRPEAVGQIHLAGHSVRGSHLIDTHDQPVSEPVWSLYQQTIERFGAVSTMIERDGNIPDLSELMMELDRARHESATALARTQSQPGPSITREVGR